MVWKMLAYAGLPCLMAAVTPASGQEGRPADPSARRAALAAVSKSCVQDYARLCPEQAGTPGARDEVICLRPLRTDLSLACRHAVTAAGS